jgi:hypothetical protein
LYLLLGAKATAVLSLRFHTARALSSAPLRTWSRVVTASRHNLSTRRIASHRNAKAQQQKSNNDNCQQRQQQQPVRDTAQHITSQHSTTHCNAVPRHATYPLLPRSSTKPFLSTTVSLKRAAVILPPPSDCIPQTLLGSPPIPSFDLPTLCARPSPTRDQPPLANLFNTFSLTTVADASFDLGVTIQAGDH